MCGEIRGRVMDARTGAPFRDVYVSLDSAPGGITTDSLGRFRFALTPFSQTEPTLTRATTLRIRRVGSMELAVILRPGLAYVIEAVLAPQQLHIDGISAVRVKHPGFCERPR